jgi:predicted nucleotidyltransferase
VIVALDVPPALARYLEELVSAVGAGVGVEAAYLVGSAASGAYEQGRSDVDVVAVTARGLTEAEKRELVERVEALEIPAVALDLVVYSREQAASAEPRFELNLNPGRHVAFTPDTGLPDESPHWYVLDRAVAEEHAVPLTGPAWGEVFAPEPRERVLDALELSLDWQERHEPLARNSALNAVRAWMWVETGEWASKPQAADWLRARVRERIEEAR